MKRLRALQLFTASLFCSLGCNQNPAIPSYEVPSSEVVGAPAVPKLSVLRPYFQTTIGTIEAGSAAGTAFAVRIDDQSEPIVLTALSVLSTRSGLSRDVVPDELNGIMKSITLGDAFGAFDGVIQAKAFIQIPHSAFHDQPSTAGDILAIHLEPQAGTRLGTFRLSDALPKKGDKVWLLIAAFVGAMPSQKQHAAIITGQDDHGNLLYTLENSKLSFEGTLGAPLLNGSGEVVAIHLGGNLKDGTNGGFGNPTLRFLQSLQASTR